MRHDFYTCDICKIQIQKEGEHYIIVPENTAEYYVKLKDDCTYEYKDTIDICVRCLTKVATSFAVNQLLQEEEE